MCGELQLKITLPVNDDYHIMEFVQNVAKIIGSRRLFHRRQRRVGVIFMYNWVHDALNYGKWHAIYLLFGL